MDLSVIIVSYNVKFYLQQCLDSVRKALLGIDSEIIVVDNHSRDGSVSFLKKIYPDVRFIESNHNLGFAAANNIAIRNSSSDYVLLLNPDTIVGEDTIRTVWDFAKSKSDFGAAGVKMLHVDGTFANESMRGIPSPMVSLYKICGLCSRYPHSKKFAHYYMSHPDTDSFHEIEVVSGAFYFISRKALVKVGYLDETFFMYGEDIDFSYRLLKSGFKNYYVPSPILHYKGESTNHSSFRYVHVFYKAMSIFFRKHYGYLNTFISLPIHIAIFAAAMASAIRMLCYRMRRFLGFVDRNDKREVFLFIGSRQAIGEISVLAQNKGLSMRCVEGDMQSLPDGHLSLVEEDNNLPTNIIYDTHAYDYKAILNLFMLHPHINRTIGTYNSDRGTIITDKEIYCNE